MNKPISSKLKKFNCRFLDVYIPKKHIIFEYDGSYWHNEEYDLERDEELSERGFKIIHYVDFVPETSRILEDLEKINTNVVYFKN